MKLLSLILILFSFVSVPTAFSHPGNTASDGCHYCWTNCASWGETYGARHCHASKHNDENQVMTPIKMPKDKKKISIPNIHEH